MRGDPHLIAVQRLLAGDSPRLRLGAVLGRGSMGVVRTAEQTAIGRQVAVKSAYTASAENVGSLLQEAWVAGVLDHPNIVPVHDIELLDGQPMVVMKQIDGVSWSSVIDDPDALRARFGRTDPLQWNLEVLLSVCNAIEYAHARGILHRDLKPSNVMVGAYGEVWVVDWGIAVSLIEAHRDRLPMAREQRRVSGTPAYMAPEMALGSGADLSERSDVYLLGALLHRIVTGTPPRAGSDVENVYQCIFVDVPIDPGWPLADLLRASLARDPAERPATVGAFRGRLQAYLSGRGARDLCARATTQLAQLRQAVATAEGADPTRHRFAIYDLYSACRFGFQTALEVAPGLTEAREGATAATICMIEAELALEDDRAAALLLSHLATPQPALAARIDALRERRLATRERLAELEADADPRTAWLARLVVMGAVSTAWVIAPVITGLLGVPPGYGREISMSGVTFVLTLILFGVLAPSLLQSRLNRVVVLCMALAPAMAVLINVGGWLARAPSELSATFEIFVYFVIATFAAVLGDTRLAPGALAFLVAFLGAMANPGHTVAWLTGATLVMGINGVLAFLPLWTTKSAEVS